MELKLERKAQENETAVFGDERASISLAPALGEDYWEYRVIVGEHQAVVGFPKFSTIGIGFAIEDNDWNTNLPYTTEVDVIFQHIIKNKGDASIPDEWVRQAIEMIQQAADADRPGHLEEVRARRAAR